MILLDTNTIVGLLNLSDSHHSRASQDFKLLRNKRLFLPTAVLTEVSFFLCEGSQRMLLLDWIATYDVQPCPEENTVEFRQEALRWAHHYREHEPDYADACLAVLSGLNPKFKIWTYDKEFTRVWRRPDGKRIPLVGNG